MTKRELITALEALPCEDTMEVCFDDGADDSSWPERIMYVRLEQGGHYDKTYTVVDGPFICLMADEDDDARV